MRKRYSRSYTVLSFLTMFSYWELPFGEPIFRILLFFRELAEELFFLLLKLSYLLPAEGVH